MFDKFEQKRHWNDNFTYIRKIIFPRLTKPTEQIIYVLSLKINGSMVNLNKILYNLVRNYLNFIWEVYNV